MSLTHGDLFAGIGGAALAAEWAGFDAAVFAENNPFCQRVLAKHWPEVPCLGDITTVTAQSFRDAGVGHLDLLHASPPCQGLSVAGKRKGKADPRYLWDDTARCIADLRPTWLCVENVANAVRMVLDDWLTDLEALGYTTWPIVVPACAVGAPHIRERLFVVAHQPFFGLADAQGFCQSLWQTEAKRPGRPPGGGPECLYTDTPGTWASVANADGRRQQSNLQRNGNTAQDSPNRYSCGDDSHGRYLDTDWLVADATSQGRDATWPIEAEHTAGAGSLSGATRPSGQDLEPGLGRDSARTAGGMDRSGLTWPGWPAGMGAHQYDYEPPRTGGKAKNRGERLQALGNAIVPQQIYPIFQAIADYEMSIAAAALSQEGEATA